MPIDEIHSALNLHLLKPICNIDIPLKGYGAHSYFTPTQMKGAIFFLASSDDCPYHIPRNIPPLTLYHLGLFLQSNILIYLALTFVTPLAAQDMLKSVLDIYPNLHQNMHPHITFLMQFISHYTIMTQDQRARLINVPLGRVLRDEVRGVIYSGTTISKFLCNICGCQYPNIILNCCQYPVHFHCLHERLMVCGQNNCRQCNFHYK